MDGGKHHHRFPARRREQPADCAVGRFDVRVISGEFLSRFFFDLTALWHIGHQGNRLRAHGQDSRCGRAVGRVGRLQADGHVSRTFASRTVLQPPRGSLANDIALIAKKFLRRGHLRAVQPRVVQQKPALKSFPKLKSAPLAGRHDHLRRGFADERQTRIASTDAPLAKKRRRIPAVTQLTRDRGRGRRQRIEIVLHPVFRGGHARQQSRPRERSKRVRRHRLRIVHTPRRECIERRRPRIHVSRVAARRRAPLRRHDPQNIWRTVHRRKSIRTRARLAISQKHGPSSPATSVKNPSNRRQRTTALLQTQRQRLHAGHQAVQDRTGALCRCIVAGAKRRARSKILYQRAVIAVHHDPK